MNIKEMRKQTKMTQKAFADYFEIPVRTLQDWERGITRCPIYLQKLVLYKLEKEGLITNE